MNLRTFIERPILSAVISISIVVVGIIGLFTLPVEQYPDIAPPTIQVSTSYFGASAETLQKSVIAPLEEAINGVGNKVSDCILLFGLGRVDSFPVDVWIKRIMEYCYFDGEQSIPAISAFAEKHFGDIGGFAQQYLFFYARENKIGTE